MAGPAEAVTEIGLLIYSGCQMAAIHGLTDLFRIAQEWAGEEARFIRVSHWQPKGETVECIWDSHPGTPHRLGHVIAPPSIVMPDRMAPEPVTAGWLRGLHAEGRCFVPSAPGPSSWPRPG